MNERPEDSRLLALAQSVSEGTSIDWDSVEDRTADDDEFQVVHALRTLDEIARAHSTPASTSRHSRSDSETATRDADADLRHWHQLALIERIGEGAFGTVYRARDERLDREVALKLLWPKFAASPNARSTVLKEARLLARVRHPNVVTVYGVEEADGRIGVWMELIKGRTLSDLLEAQGPLGAREAATIGVDLCSALAAVHGVGLLHRDIKARNVMRAEGGRIVLMDFGAGVDVAVSAIRGGPPDMAGTPLYLAPEIFDSGRATIQSDIYSLGVLLFHLVSNTYPVDSSTYEEIANAHQRGARRLLRDLRPDLPEAFVRVIERAVAPDAPDRFPSAGTLAEALSSSVGVTPTPNPVERQRWLVPIIGTALATLAIVAGLWWRTASTSNRETGAPTASAPPTTVVAANTPGEYEISAAFHNAKRGDDAVVQPGSAVAPEDTLYLTVRSSVPTYVYVVNQDDHGEVNVLFPIPGRTMSNPLPAGTMQRIPTGP